MPTSPDARATTRLAVAGILVAGICCSPFSKSIPAALIGLLLPPREAGLVIAGYLALGAFGLPVFHTFRAGAGNFLAPDGGYILAVLPQAMLTSWVYRRRRGSPWARLAPALLAGFLVHLALGSLGIMLLADLTREAAVTGLVLQAPWISAKVAVVGQMFRILEPRLPAAMREEGASIPGA